MQKTITTYHLEMTSPDQLCPSTCWPKKLSITRAHIPSPPLNRFLYTAVGGDWQWTDRLSWTYDEWMGWLDRETLETWIAYVRGTPAGYFELEMQAQQNVEIAYFGLIGQFVNLIRIIHCFVFLVTQTDRFYAARSFSKRRITVLS